MTKIRKVTHFAFDIPLYGIRIHVRCGDCPAAAKLVFQKIMSCEIRDDDDWDTVEGYVTGRGGNVCVWFRDVKPKAHIVAHEAVHVASKVCMHLGIKGDFTNDEPLAYLIGHVVRQIGRRVW